MAERRAAGFNIPLNFYDGPEVESIPKRIRAAAIGVWALAGDYSATQLTDGYVGPGILKMLGCTDAIRAALKATINKKGELSPLWIDARNGGIQLTNWPKHQRTSDEVTTYRASEAERKRLEREAKRNSSTSINGKTSGRTNDGHDPDVQTDARDPKTETETKTEEPAHFGQSATEPNQAGVSATPGANLVRSVIPNTLPAATRTELRLQANALLRQGHTAEDVTASLQLWMAKTGVAPRLLPNLLADVLKTQTNTAQPSNGRVVPINANGLTTGEAKVAAWAALGAQPSSPHTDRKAIES